MQYKIQEFVLLTKKTGKNAYLGLDSVRKSIVADKKDTVANQDEVKIMLSKTT